MTRKFLPIACLLLAAARAPGQDLVDSGMRLAPVMAWEGSNRQTFAVQRTEAVTGGWQTVDVVSSQRDGTQSWIGRNRTAETSGFFRVALLPETNRPFADGFETAGEWVDQLDLAWTSRVASGVWSGLRCYTEADSAKAHASDRCMRISTASSAYLELPPVDFPTQIVYWAKSSSNGIGLYMAVRSFNGRTWPAMDIRTIASTNYEMNRIPLGLSMKNQRLRIGPNGGYGGVTAYIDDVQVFSRQPTP